VRPKLADRPAQPRSRAISARHPGRGCQSAASSTRPWPVQKKASSLASQLPLERRRGRGGPVNLRANRVVLCRIRGPLRRRDGGGPAGANGRPGRDDRGGCSPTASGLRNDRQRREAVCALRGGQAGRRFLDRPEVRVGNDRAARVDDQRADPLTGPAGEVADHRQRDPAPPRTVPVQRHPHPRALKPLTARPPRDASRRRCRWGGPKVAQPRRYPRTACRADRGEQRQPCGREGRGWTPSARAGSTSSVGICAAPPPAPLCAALATRRAGEVLGRQADLDHACRSAALPAQGHRATRRCGGRSGRLLRHISTADTARDLDYLRRLVGDRRLTYLGISAGTFIGQTYVNMFPRRVRAVALDAVIDPVAWTKGSAAALSSQLTDADLVFAKFRSLCQTDRSRARRRAHARHLPGRPIPASPRPPRRQPRLARSRPLAAHRRLAHAANRRDLHRPRRRLLHPPRPPTHDPTPHRPTPTPRPHRHPHRSGRRLTNGIFSSETNSERDSLSWARYRFAPKTSRSGGHQWG
jgi:pimeloyl-ACP methyl ester carboxylesterase